MVHWPVILIIKFSHWPTANLPHLSISTVTIYDIIVALLMSLSLDFCVNCLDALYRVGAVL